MAGNSQERSLKLDWTEKWEDLSGSCITGEYENISYYEMLAMGIFWIVTVSREMMSLNQHFEKVVCCILENYFDKGKSREKNPMPNCFL